MLFAKYFLEQTTTELGKEIQEFDDDVIECFESYSWPGNIREMKNVIRRAALPTQEGKTVAMNSLPLEMATPSHDSDVISTTALPDDDNAPNLKNIDLIADYEPLIQVHKQ